MIVRYNYNHSTYCINSDKFIDVIETLIKMLESTKILDSLQKYRLGFLYQAAQKVLTICLIIALTIKLWLHAFKCIHPQFLSSVKN